MLNAELMTKNAEMMTNMEFFFFKDFGTPSRFHYNFLAHLVRMRLVPEDIEAIVGTLRIIAILLIDFFPVVFHNFKFRSFPP